MTDLTGLRVVVAGAGAVGSATALVLARRGAQVTLADPAPVGDNASGVAAGMLAPAAEALLDPVASEHFPLLKAARDRWQALLQGVAAPALDRSGAILGAADPEPLLARARSIGAHLQPIGEAEARRLAPGLAGAGPRLFTADDWRLDPRPMLAALHAALEAAGGQRLAMRATGLQDAIAALDGEPGMPADALVLATGAAGGGLTPIKGQILRFPGAGPARGPVIRGEGIYLAPGAGGAVAGATMEAGRADLTIDPDVVERLRAAAVRLLPQLEGAPVQAFAGVRAATADGLPLAGPSGAPGVLVARGARRNGWLLAPLIAEVIAERLAGGARSAAAAAFDPARLAGAEQA